MKTQGIPSEPAAGESALPLGTTRERVLDVAERLFAERGLDAVSIRDITGEAEVHLGAINYHFGTKENLIAAVLERRIAPVSEERLRAFDAAEQRAGDAAPNLEALLEAMFRPAVRQAMERGGTTFRKLLARCFVEPNPAVEKVLCRHWEPLVKRFEAVLLRVLPQLTAQDVFWRMHLLMGALHQSLLMLDRMPFGEQSLRMDPEKYIRRFVALSAAAFKAQLPD